jgi:hypothetical protein
MREVGLSPRLVPLSPLVTELGAMQQRRDEGGIDQGKESMTLLIVRNPVCRAESIITPYNCLSFSGLSRRRSRVRALPLSPFLAFFASIEFRNSVNRFGPVVSHHWGSIAVRGLVLPSTRACTSVEMPVRLCCPRRFDATNYL